MSRSTNFCAPRFRMSNLEEFTTVVTPNYGVAVVVVVFVVWQQQSVYVFMTHHHHLRPCFKFQLRWIPNNNSNNKNSNNNRRNDWKLRIIFLLLFDEARLMIKCLRLTLKILNIRTNLTFLEYLSRKAEKPQKNSL